MMKFPAITACFVAQSIVVCVVAVIVCVSSSFTKLEAVVSVVLCASMVGYWSRDYLVRYAESRCLAAYKNRGSSTSRFESTAKIEGATDGY